MNLKQVGGVTINGQHRASCHCGAVALLLDLPDGLVDVRRCNCSLCRRRGAIVASVPLAAIHVEHGSGDLRLYQFNTKTAKHYFCGRCGIYTHHQRRSNPAQYAFNVACLDGVDPLVIDDVPVYDGVHHPSDERNDG